MIRVPRQTLVSVDAAVRAVFGGERAIRSTELIGGDSGIFSDLVLVTLDGPPWTLVAKTVRDDPDGRNAAAAGFDRNEEQAYLRISALLGSVVPRFYGSHCGTGGQLVLLIEDLTSARWLDQAPGCEDRDTSLVATTLADLGDRSEVAGGLPRRFLADLDGAQLQEGIGRIRGFWSEGLSPEAVDGYRAVFSNWMGLARSYDALGDLTLCHGDPRADNMAVVRGHLVLVDWQQANLGPRDSDLAWFFATSLDRRDRTARVRAGREAYGLGLSDERLTILLARPALLSIFLATRRPNSPRAAETITRTLDRIGSMVGEFG